jgi:hypothetical protein
VSYAVIWLLGGIVLDVIGVRLGLAIYPVTHLQTRPPNRCIARRP